MNTMADFRSDYEAQQDPLREPDGAAIDLRRIWALVYRNRILIGGCVLAGVLLGLLYLALATPVYRATASVQIDEASVRVLNKDESDAARNPLDTERYLQTQLGILRSRAVAEAVAQSERLFGSEPFLLAMNEDGELEPTPVLTPRQAERERVIAILQENLSIELPPDSRLASVSFDSPDPQLAARIANSFADSYIRSDLQRRFNTSAYAREFISKQLETARRQLEESERAALDYASRERLIDASNGASTGAEESSAPKSLTVSRLVRLNSALAEAVTRRTQAEQKWRLAQGTAVMSLPEVLENQAVQDLLRERATAVANYERELQTRREDHPSVRQARAQVSELDQQVSGIANSIRGSLRSNYEVARSQEASLQGQIRGLEGATLDEQQRNVRLSLLQRATDTNRSLYDSLLQRFRELSAEAGVQPNNITLIDRAEIPSKPVHPNLIVVLALSLIGGLVLGIAGAFVLEHLNDTVRSVEDLDRKLGLPMLGSIPQVADVSSELSDPKSAVSEAYSSVRAAILMSSRHGLPRSMAFTSVQAGEGKTTSSSTLAKGLGRVGKSVVVIDCDLRRPALHKAFEIKNGPGVSEFLSGQTAVSEIVRGTSEPSVSIITSGHIPPNPTELLSGPLFRRLLDDLKEQFDVVIVDAPPVLGLADAVLIGSEADATILIMQSGRNYRGSLKSAVARLSKGGVRIIGAVLTKQNMRALGYSYDYKYQYSYG